MNSLDLVAKSNGSTMKNCRYVKGLYLSIRRLRVFYLSSSEGRTRNVVHP